MTRRRLIWTLLLSVAGYAIVIAIAGYVIYSDPTPNRRLADAVKSVLTPSLAIPAAIFGWIFQRRLAYVASLRVLFEHLAAAVQQALQLTRASSPPTTEYGPVLQKLSLIIDEVRTVFPNRNERPLVLRGGELDAQNRVLRGRHGTAYPLEPVKDLYTLIEMLQRDAWSTERAAKYREEILKRWRIMQEVLFLEFDRAPPPAWITVESPAYRVALQATHQQDIPLRAGEKGYELAVLPSGSGPAQPSVNREQDGVERARR